MQEKQFAQVLNHLKNYGCITSWQAITDYHITRLSQYIYLLRNEGFNIIDTWQSDGKKKWKLYKLEGQK